MKKCIIFIREHPRGCVYSDKLNSREAVDVNHALYDTLFLKVLRGEKREIPFFPPLIQFSVLSTEVSHPHNIVNGKFLRKKEKTLTVSLFFLSNQQKPSSKKLTKNQNRWIHWKYHIILFLYSLYLFIYSKNLFCCLFSKCKSLEFENYNL